jgi:hypothetical protein
MGDRQGQRRHQHQRLKGYDLSLHRPGLEKDGPAGMTHTSFPTSYKVILGRTPAGSWPLEFLEKMFTFTIPVNARLLGEEGL